MKNRSGFTLLEIVIAVAIVALLAGAATPLIFRELQQAREDATLAEMQAIKAGLEEFYADTGRFPTEGEGLVALAADPGVTGWSGPYVGGGRSNPSAEVIDDAFGGTYLYDLAPTTNPAGAADVLVASGGVDQTITFGSVGTTWTVAGNGDDLLLLVSSGQLLRDKSQITRERLEGVGTAARQFFKDNEQWPATLGDLAPDYMDLGIESSAITDGWNFTFTLSSNGGTPPSLSIISRGPNQVDDSGSGDDLVLQLSGHSAGRSTTLERLQIAQTALNADPAASLTGTWATDLATLGLSTALANDGWGQPLLVNTSSRVIYSAGPDNNAATTSDNLPRGVGP